MLLCKQLHLCKVRHCYFRELKSSMSHQGAMKGLWVMVHSTWWQSYHLHTYLRCTWLACRSTSVFLVADYLTKEEIFLGYFHGLTTYVVPRLRSNPLSKRDPWHGTASLHTINLFLLLPTMYNGVYQISIPLNLGLIVVPPRCLSCQLLTAEILSDSKGVCRGFKFF